MDKENPICRFIKEKWKSFTNAIRGLIPYIIDHGFIGSVLGLLKLLLKLLVILISAILGGRLFIGWLQYQPKRIAEPKANKKKLSVSSWLEKENANRLLAQFKDQWIKADNNTCEDTLELLNQKVKFYQWMETNYKIHLESQSRNKTKHFKNAHKGSWYQSISAGASRTAALISGFLTFAVGSAFGLKEIWRYLTTKPVVDKLPRWGRMPIFALAVALVVFAVLYIFRVLFQTEHIKRVDRIDRREETWLRHTEAIQNYQREMISYLVKSGEYGKYLAKEDNDRIFMKRIIEVWNKNGEKFLSNMTKPLQTKEENKVS